MGVHRVVHAEYVHAAIARHRAVPIGHMEGEGGGRTVPTDDNVSYVGIHPGLPRWTFGRFDAVVTSRPAIPPVRAIGVDNYFRRCFDCVAHGGYLIHRTTIGARHDSL